MDVESHDGAFHIEFLGHGMTNAYLNVTNINVLVSPRGEAAKRPAVMIVAHHDAPISSPGEGFITSPKVGGRAVLKGGPKLGEGRAGVG